MAPKAALLVPSKRKASIRETLEKVRFEGGQVKFDFIENLETRARELRTFRWQAPATQNRQDRHIYLYLEMIRTLEGLPEDMSHVDIHPHAFPQDHEKLFQYLEMFLILCFKTTQPRSNYGVAEIAWGTLATFRASMLYWVARIYGQLKRDPPTNTAAFNRMTTTMNGLNVQDRSSVDPIFATVKTHVGLTEIRQLIESDMMRTACIENAEQHHLAWCLGRFLALRPASIGAESFTGPGNTRHQPHLVWRDVVLQRDPSDKGRFTAVITIRHWKHTRDADADRSGPKTYTLVSPPADQLIFSVPHRLLVIALRRGILLDYNTIEDLLAGDLANITIRDDQLDEPIFYASGPRGLELDTSKPLNAHALTDYIRERGKTLGYPHPITFYSIRRRAATDLSVNYSKDLSREVMNHTTDSRTLETSYLDIRQGFNPTAAGLGIQLGAFGHDPAISGPSSLAVNTLDPARLLRTQGEALNLVTRELMASDPDNSAIGTDEYKNYRRRIRNQAYRILVTAQTTIQAREDTLDTLNERSLLAQASLFHDEVMRYAKDSTLASTLEEVPGEDRLDEAQEQLSSAAPEDEEEEDPDSLFVGSQEDEPALEEPFGEDITAPGSASRPGDSTPGPSAPGPSAPGPSAPGPSSRPGSSISYELMAKMSMSLITNNVLSTQQFWETRDKRCPACNEDPTMSQEDKDKEYRSLSVLTSHMSSNVHSGLERVKRQLEINAKALASGRYYCLYSCGKNWARRRDCIEHMDNSTEATDGAEHDAAKAADGWYDAGFKGTGSIQYHKELERNRKRLYLHTGLEFEEIPQLQHSIPHPTDPDIVLGDFAPYTIPSHLQDEIVELSPDELADPHRSGWRASLQADIDAGHIIEYENISDVPQMPIPPRLKWHVTETDEIPTILKKKRKTDKTDNAGQTGQAGRRVSWAPMQ
ncbi:uncharacterized protein M437DRAFT_36615 [Aureobasidium melanogenum CBS 110374]|uniref:Uncharacterized protein n=1 Tax=Aureobasidium melanogenum (strain CBS 110374) TaxID=1043003 RepID=A0A074WCM7_AURM1|nr:uncharacterized protein M437DRAFT_36615 [Aureobasidium melanogenum CBS 110374]KEQ67642.1 hypothetical protein M437DRAFT_36615 [Aureobasidium melanogenum CBS 110374]